MTMHTIFVLLDNNTNEVADIAPQLGAQEALAHFKYGAMWSGTKGKVYACRLSETAAQDVREAFIHTPGLGQPTALTLLKRYSSHMNYCADVT